LQVDSPAEGQERRASGSSTGAAKQAAARGAGAASEASEYLNDLAQVTVAALGRMSMDYEELTTPASAADSDTAGVCDQRQRRRRRTGGGSSSSSGGGHACADVDGPAAGAVAAGAAAEGEQDSMCCSVITAAHVAALAQLPRLSSLELCPARGAWDDAGCQGLLQLSALTALTRLAITWGDAAAAAAAGKPLSHDAAVAAARGEQLPLQRCLAGLPQLRELVVNGASVVDVAVLQGLSQLRRLAAEGMHVVDSDIGPLLLQPRDGTGPDAGRASSDGAHQAAPAADGVAAQQQPLLPLLGGAAHAAAAQGEPGAADVGGAQQQQRRRQQRRWATLPQLELLHAVHPAADISALLSATLTPQLTHLGLVTRGPSDFARLLGHHGKLRTLHLAFAEEEAWHPIAVVRLPTALPALRSLTLEGTFMLPNSLIVALGVMDVPLQHLSLRCKLAVPCLQRLQHLKHLQRLALHHMTQPWPAVAATVAAAGQQQQQQQTPEQQHQQQHRWQRAHKGAAKSGAGGDGMLQLPAKLLPPQLQELEISNGWILH
jgi:hypothetical protein